jgi:peptide/nickel transport system substrate-binding protein
MTCRRPSSGLPKADRKSHEICGEGVKLAQTELGLMRIDKGRGLVGLLMLAATVALATPAAAQTRAETLRQVTGNTINTLDPTLPGATREAFGLSMNVYDRLVAFERKKVGAGWIFDYGHIRGELAESYAISEDGLKIVFHLRRDAKFHDGTPVTAEDVKWSLDRHVSAKSLAAPQLASGSLTKPEQFAVIDPYAIEVTLEKPDRLALPNLAIVYAIVINSKLAKQHATSDDPWAQNWLKDNTAGSGAYTVESFKPGEQVVLRRNDNWKSGPNGALPFFKRVIAQTIPEAATRANLVERGDADLAIDLQPNAVVALEESKKVKVISTPQFNAFTMVAFNTRTAPFDNVKVRQAIAAAMPYDDIFKASIFGRGAPLFNGSWSDAPPDGKFPQPLPVKTDLAKAKQLLNEAGLPNGFETTFSFNVGSAAVSEPMASLIKENLAKIGIKTEIQKLPDAQISTLISEKKLPFLTESSIAWLPSTDYFFRIFFHGDQRWNYSSWDNPEVAQLVQEARFERDPAKYEVMAKRLIAIEAADMPMILLWQPSQDAVMAANIDGFTYWFHRQVDFRDLRRE